MASQLYNINGSWPGTLVMTTRPRGGDWLQNDVSDWKRAGIHSVVSLLTRDEESELDLRDEAGEVRRQGLAFYSLPIPDRQVPKSETKVRDLVEDVNRRLHAGQNVLVHCRQGVGRSGLVAACLLVRNGMSPGAAVETISSTRGVAVPETPEQRAWIERYAPAIAK